MSGRDDRVIVFDDGSTVTLICDVDWWALPVSTIAAIREAVDTLSSLGTVAERPSRLEQSVVLLPEIEPDPEPPAGSFPCPSDDCGATFASENGAKIHFGRQHRPGRNGRAFDDEPAATPDEPESVTPATRAAADDINEPAQYLCETCLASTSTYNDLAEHTQQWHNRFPHRSERRGDERPTPDEEPPLAADAEFVLDEPPAAAKAYYCDDCDDPIEDGRALFRHCERVHQRAPHQWERQMRTAAERVTHEAV